jgi:proteic killer suppression protein
MVGETEPGRLLVFRMLLLCQNARGETGTIDYRIACLYSLVVIVSFRHKGLEEFYRSGSRRGIQAAHAKKLSLILSALDQARRVEDLRLPSFRLHELKGQRTAVWSIWVNGNWRVTFRFAGEDVELLDYEDYH